MTEQETFAEWYSNSYSFSENRVKHMLDSGLFKGGKTDIACKTWDHQQQKINDLTEQLEIARDLMSETLYTFYACDCAGSDEFGCHDCQNHGFIPKDKLGMDLYSELETKRKIEAMEKGE